MSNAAANAVPVRCQNDNQKAKMDQKTMAKLCRCGLQGGEPPSETGGRTVDLFLTWVFKVTG